MFTHRYAQPRKPDRVVVVGGRGFIGKAIFRQLETEAVEAIAMTSSDVDLTASSAVDGLAERIRPTDAVVMLSALTPDKGRDIATLMKNLAMMQHLCGALGKTGCAHLIYFSSDAVYSPDVSRVTEETPASPRDLYGVMHYARELMAKGVGVPALILRPTLVYGVDDTHNAYGPNRFRRAAQKDGTVTLFGEGEEMRDHISVDDVASLSVRCLVHATVGTLNLATGASASFRDVAERVAAQFAGRISVKSIARQSPITHRHYDVTNLIRAFPDFRFTSLDEGIERMHRAVKGA